MDCIGCEPSNPPATFSTAQCKLYAIQYRACVVLLIVRMSKFSTAKVLFYMSSINNVLCVL